MRIAVFGLGYVGCVSVGCLARLGHELIGVDVNPQKLALINSGSPTIVEAGIGELIREAWDDGRITATDNAISAARETDASIICVGTPNAGAGHLSLDHVFQVADDIAEGLKQRQAPHTVLIRSTVLPGTNAQVRDRIAAQSGKTAGKDFHVVSNPEFLREGTAVDDFFNPPATVLGADHAQAFAAGRKIYGGIDAPIKEVSVAAAETIKMVNNAWHALKVSFANEIGVICKSLDIDSHELMDLFCQDTKLNLSSYYLKPGYAYGGSCLPKDLKALNTIAHDRYLDTPVLTAVDRSNGIHQRRLIDMIHQTGKRRIALLGLSFKAGTDDLRNSPIVEAAETLLGRGFKLRIFDRNVHLSNLTGTNRAYIEAKIPHLAELISDDLEDVVRDAELVVVANREEEFASISPSCPQARIIDLVRMGEALKDHPGGYEGIAW